MEPEIIDIKGPAKAAYMRALDDALKVLEGMIDGDSRDDVWITDAIEKIKDLPLPVELR